MLIADLFKQLHVGQVASDLDADEPDAERWFAPAAILAAAATFAIVWFLG